MKNAIATILTFSVIAAACNGGSGKKEAENDSLPAETALNSGTACYLKAVGRDTFRLQLVINDEQVAGQLDYDFHEKDKSSGTLAGVLQDNILRASYSYRSEGMNSVRPVIFKLMGDQVYEAQADNFDDKGVPVFPEANEQLRFEPSPYNRKDCE